MYPASWAKRTAASQIDSRRPGSNAGDGASSTTFWWRRWIEHSLSKRCKTLPCSSPITCTSTWRGSSTSFSRNTDPSPNAPSPRPPDRLYEIRLARYGPHPASPATGARLDQDGEADAARLLGETVLPVIAGDRRHVGPSRQLLCPDLVADGVHRLRRGAYPDRAGRSDRSGKFGALREEAVAGMHGFGA